MKYWLLKTEPSTYSWDTLERESSGIWDGVRNHQARQNLEKMTKGDLVFIYHTGNEKAVVGIASVTEEPFPEPADKNWTAVKIQPKQKLKNPVTLEMIKSDKILSGISLIKMSRLSVHSFSKVEFDTILSLSKKY